nr:kelch repeat-containing protein [Allomuricauda sp.]
MKKIVLYFKHAFICILSFGLLASCSQDDDEDLGNWIDRSVFDGVPRSGASSFVIGDIGYVGGGYDGDDYLNSFWAYDMEGDFWSQKADFPGVARNAAVGFQIDGIGYIGSGYDGVDELNDFYRYDPTTNSWTQAASITSIKRRSALAFSANGYGYFGTGYDGENDKKDFWKYDPSTDTWTEIEGFGGDKRRSATTFVLNGMVYMGTGVSNGTYLDDFWVFDPTEERWTKRLDLDEEDDYDISRSNAVGFALNGYGYIACGERNGATNTVWEYDAASDTWEAKTGFEGATRQDATAFSNGYRAFIGLGRTGTLYLDDLDEFFPFEEYDDED